MIFFRLTIWLFFFGYNLSAASEQTLVILQTTDIHCHLTGKYDNWLKLATIIKQERLSAGRDNCLLIDCGDTVAGTFAATTTQGDIAVKMLNMLNYDVWIPGNHEYDFGLAALLRYHRDFSGSMLAANFKIAGDNKKQFGSWKMFQRKGIKIAVIGLSLPDSEKNYWRNSPFSVVSVFELMPEIMNDVNRQQPDLIILAAHCGIYSANKAMLKIAKQYPEINLLLGGHTHVTKPGEKIGSQGWYVQDIKHAQGVAKISIKITLPDKRIDKIKSTIIPVTAATPIDMQCFTSLRDELKKISKLKQQKLGRTTVKISALAESGELSSAAELNGLAIAAAAKTEIAFASAHYRANIPPGIINRNQAFLLYPYQDTVCRLSLTAAETISVIEEQAKCKSRYHWLSPVGLKVDLNSHGKVVGKLRFADGKYWLDNKQRVKIAFSSYDLAGIYGRKYLSLHKLSLAPECGGLNTEIKVYQAIADYIQKNAPLGLKK
jgi:5'-nucleotidase / UDP-sugar diphosphatase